jgi:hypothetical protein
MPICWPNIRSTPNTGAGLRPEVTHSPVITAVLSASADGAGGGAATSGGGAAGSGSSARAAVAAQANTATNRKAAVPVDDSPTGAVEDRTQVVEGAGEVEVGDVDVPVLMGTDGLDEPGSLRRGPGIPAFQKTGEGKNPIDGRRGTGDDVAVDHPVREPAIPVERVAVMEVEDGLLLGGGQPVVAGNLPVRLVGRAVPTRPGVVLGRGQAGPVEQPLGG